MELKLPQLFLGHGIEHSADIEDIGKQLQHIAVAEWINAEDYQHFIGEEHSVTEEAPKILEEGFFFRPANAMALAISNVLGLPIIVFSSAMHYPIINIVARVFKLSAPLYIAFSQCGAGHYDAVSFRSTYLPSESFSNQNPKTEKKMLLWERCKTFHC